ncbi:hypothetical protein [Dankookia sp. P2]|uniref:hypothetical protein n=1 Tax=Dankookia sp. P2 TaxID=3423955 RepID=UPI003D676CF9
MGVLGLALGAALATGALVVRPVRALTRQAEAVAAGVGSEAPEAASRFPRVAEFERLRLATGRAEGDPTGRARPGEALFRRGRRHAAGARPGRHGAGDQPARA